MSSREFYNKLAQIGYPDADKLRLGSLDFLLEDEELLPFFEFLQQIDENNILTPEEVKRYEELEASGAKIVELDDVKSVRDGSKETEVPIEDLRKDVLLLSEELAGLQQEKTMAKCLNDSLSKQLMLMNAHLEKAKTEAKEAEKAYRSVEMDCKAVNKEMNKVFDDAKAQLTTIEHIAKMASTTARDSLYLTFTPLENFQKTYNEYNTLMNEYIFKQFPAKVINIAELGSEQNNKLIDLKIHQVENISDEHVKMYKLLKVHHDSFWKLENKLVMASATENGMKKQIKAGEQLLAFLRKNSFPNTTILSHRLSEYKADEVKYIAKVNNLRDNVLPKLSISLADVNASSIITGNYDLKWKRQKYVISKMDELIFWLSEQLSNAEFYNFCLKSEYDLFKQLHEFLQFVEATSNAQLDGFKSRMAAMEQLCVAIRNHEESEKNSSALMAVIGKIIQSCSSPPGGKSVLTRIQRLLNKVEWMKDSMIDCEMKVSGNFADETKRLDQINSGLMNLKDAVWADRPTKSGPPHLGPKEIDDYLEKFEAKFKKLDFEFLAARLKLEEKEKMLKSNGNLKKLKTCYLNFYNQLVGD